MKNTCSQTSLHDFIRCLFHQDYSVLSEGKECKSDELMNAWQQIYEEYCLISGSPEYTKILKCLNEIIRLQKILLHGRAAVTVLSYKYSQPDIEVLKQIGFNYEFSATDRKSYDKDVINCANRLKGFEVQLQIQDKKRLELFGLDENGQPKGKKQEQTEADFLKSVAIVGKSNGYHIQLRNTMLDEWAGMVKLHNEMNQK
jgi:hypothetical protein